jgi:hypothetical protein
MHIFAGVPVNIQLYLVFKFVMSCKSHANVAAKITDRRSRFMQVRPQALKPEDPHPQRHGTARLVSNCRVPHLHVRKV